MVLNNCEARLRQWINGSKHNLRQTDHSPASISKMKLWSDALLVPHARKNGQQQPGQPRLPQLQSATIQARAFWEAQISDRKGAALSPRHHNFQAPTPDNQLT